MRFVVHTRHGYLYFVLARKHHEAHDYVVKSETAFLRLEKIIKAIFDFRKTEKELQWYMNKM